ncbi:unnamed protein product [Mycena citricolor]|uniref:Ndc10 domain-containing protein n=1 Tax=Mycena citricolor TaxID=2018698 RepID=A0AAD2H566_9AGAR|nr:unnamed protein product [Mycena citricolor]
MVVSPIRVTFRCDVTDAGDLPEVWITQSNMYSAHICVCATDMDIISGTPDYLIDPALRDLGHPRVKTCVTNTSHAQSSDPNDDDGDSARLPTHNASGTAANVGGGIGVTRDMNGGIVETAPEYRQRLFINYKRKKPLHEYCQQLGLKAPKQANLKRLHDILLSVLSPSFDYQQAKVSGAYPKSLWCLPQKSLVPTHDMTQSRVLEAALTSGTKSLTVSAPAGSRLHPAPLPHRGEFHGGIPLSVSVPFTCPSRSEEHSATQDSQLGEDEDDSPVVFRAGEDPESERVLLREFCADAAAAAELLGQDEGASDEEDQEGDMSEEETNGTYKEHVVAVRVEANKRFEAGRRQGGIAAQKSCIKAVNEFSAWAFNANKIKDNIIDENFLLQFIKYHAEREKRSRRGVPLPDTRLGASQLKKFFFGALRVRKEQDARDSKLARIRPSTTGLVWDTIKERMSDAIKNSYSGNLSGEDAPDVVANTILENVSDADRERIGQAFLAHRHQRLAVFGHLAWTGQSATGNRGDDIRSLALCEIQPYEMAHPTQVRQQIYCLLGLQSQEKAGKRGMKTAVNPSYTVFVAHRNPAKCPLGAFAIYFHWLYDSKALLDLVDINWEKNSSWRKIFLLHGPSSPDTPFNQQSLYKLYAKAFDVANFESRIKQHLARHLLGYDQAKMNVDANETSKMGWSRGQTYIDVYAAAIPKNVGRDFPLCKKNLKGAENHWAMIIKLRPYLFQCAGALYQICPNSQIFNLPAFTTDVRNWMKTEYPQQLSALKAQSGDPTALASVQNDAIRSSLSHVFSSNSSIVARLDQLEGKIDRRTAHFSPTKGFSISHYHHQLEASVAVSAATGMSSPIILHRDANDEVTGTYELTDDHSVRAFASPQPADASCTRPITQVDYVLPPIEAFFARNNALGFAPPIIGQKAATWSAIFLAIKQPGYCWSVWAPAKTLDKYSSVSELWSVFADGEPRLDSRGQQTGVKPPLRLVEETFGEKWRAGPAVGSKPVRQTARKRWERFREIPDWITAEVDRRNISPLAVVQELEELRKRTNENGFTKTIGLFALAEEVKEMRIARVKQLQAEEPTPGSLVCYRLIFATFVSATSFISAASFVSAALDILAAHAVPIATASTAIFVIEYNAKSTNNPRASFQASRATCPSASPHQT